MVALPGDRFFCTKCPDGYYCEDFSMGSLNVQSVPIIAKEGHFVNDQGNRLAQEACPPGTYGQSKGLSTTLCSGLCMKGHFCPLGSIQPNPCRQGYYQSNEGQDHCLICPIGYATTMTGMIKCMSCPKGYISQKNGSKFCNKCPSGWYNQHENTKKCELCLKGTFSNVGSSSCSLCPKGYYQISNEQSFCLSCNPGRYNNIRGNSIGCIE